MTSGKICLITGATSGIGKATAFSLARQGATVLLVSRDKEKGGKVRNDIVERTGNEGVRLYIADLSSQKEIRRLAGDIRTDHPRIDVLVNNAGGIFERRMLTVDGIEMTLALNHLACFLLTNLLLEMLSASPSARVVSVSSQAHYYGTMELGDLGYEHGYSPMKSYARSKLAILLFT